jgi:hypothetical protein
MGVAEIGVQGSAAYAEASACHGEQGSGKRVLLAMQALAQRVASLVRSLRSFYDPAPRDSFESSRAVLSALCLSCLHPQTSILRRGQVSRLLAP